MMKATFANMKIGDEDTLGVYISLHLLEHLSTSLLSNQSIPLHSIPLDNDMVVKIVIE